MSENLAELRRAVGLSQVELAAKAGVSYTTIQRLEAGRSDGRVETLQAIARALDVPITELLAPNAAEASS